jgi:isocitrate dehydrogenase
LHLPKVKDVPKSIPRKEIGVDIYIESSLSSENLGKSLEDIALSSPFFLKMISNRSVQVYPSLEGIKPDMIDQWRARFFLKNKDDSITDIEFLTFIERVGHTHQWMHVEKLQEFNDVPAFTKAQGES